MTTDKQLMIWTVYDHPKDYPHNYVVRGWIIPSNPTRYTEPLLFTSLSDARNMLADMGLSRIARDESDDPCILESWV